ncbi:MAG TPA: hypothetical protein VGK01_13455 [Candidatus Angelobacter sp.]
MRDILKTLLDKAPIAFLVMTGEDETVTGKLHPRLNVVPEAGLLNNSVTPLSKRMIARSKPNFP